MEKKLYNIFWTTNAKDFIDNILESSYKVLPKKVKTATFNGSYNFHGSLNFSTIFTFKV